MASEKDVPGRLSKHTSSPPPGPTGNPPRLPRTTSYRVENVAASQLKVVWSKATRFWVSGGAVIGVPPQPPPPQTSPVVHALPSSHIAVLFAADPVRMDTPLEG